MTCVSRRASSFTRKSHAASSPENKCFRVSVLGPDDVGSIPITRSKPSQGQPARARTIRQRIGVEMLAHDGLRWLPLHKQRQLRFVTTHVSQSDAARANEY